MEYQINYSELYSHEVENERSRVVKAKKTFAIINDYYFKEDLSKLNVLEVGCFTGEISIYLSKYFKEYRAIDIDRKAIEHAIKKNDKSNLKFEAMNAEELLFKKNTFDIVINSHIYEHVPNPNRLMSEIYRVLKDDGICYFAAGNKYKIIEPHYRLPFLSWFPKNIANAYLKLTGRGLIYYENHFSYLKLRELVSSFRLIDYTERILDDPKKFHADDMLNRKSLKIAMAKIIYRYCRFFFPTFIWVLKKEQKYD